MNPLLCGMDLGENAGWGIVLVEKPKALEKIGRFHWNIT